MCKSSVDVDRQNSDLSSIASSASLRLNKLKLDWNASSSNAAATIPPHNSPLSVLLTRESIPPLLKVITKELPSCGRNLNRWSTNIKSPSTFHNILTVLLSRSLGIGKESETEGITAD